LRLRAPVVQPSFVRLAARLAPSQAPLHALRSNTIQTGVLPSCARSGSPLVPRSQPGPVTPRQPQHTAPDNRRGTLRASSAVCSSERTSFPVPPYGGPVHAARSPPQPSHHALRKIQTGARCSIRPVRGAYRADLAPVGFNTAPSRRAGNRRSNRYVTPCHGTCFKRLGSTPRLRFAASGLSIDTLWTQALQRSVRIAAFCSNRHAEASASRSRPRRIGRFRRRAILRRFVPHPRKMAKYAAARARKSLAPASEPLGPSRAAEAASAISVPVSTNASTARPFQAPRTRLRLEAAYGGRCWRAARFVPGTAIGPGSKFRPDRCRHLLRPLKRVTHLASLARQLFRRAHRSTGA
jgi:hypothetical protein